MEVVAVKKTAEMANNAGNNKKKINIYVDSQVAIKAIILHCSTSENILGGNEAVDVAGGE